MIMAGFEYWHRFLIFFGLFIALLGVLFIFCEKTSLMGRLPGDIFLQKGNFRFLFPIVSCLVLSVVLTILVNLVLKLLGK